MKKAKKYQTGGTTVPQGTNQKRRTVARKTTKPGPGIVGGSTTTSKTTTVRGKKGTTTKTKSVSKGAGPGKTGIVTKTKSVGKKTSGPFGRTMSTPVKSSMKRVSGKKAGRMQKRMK